MTHDTNQVDSLVNQLAAGKVGRRDFLRKLVAVGVSSATAYTLLNEKANAQFTVPRFGAPPSNNIGRGRPTTMALGEEGSPRPTPNPNWRNLRQRPPATTQALGEEGTPGITTHAIGEEGQPTPRPVTTQAVGEECMPGTPPRKVTTRAIGEEGSPRATTLRVGEEGSPGPTTMMIGEEGGTPVRPQWKIQKPIQNSSPWNSFKRW